MESVDPPSAARGSGSSPGQVTVKVLKVLKLRKFLGVRDHHLIEDWILDAKRAIGGGGFPPIPLGVSWTRRKTPQKLYFDNPDAVTNKGRLLRNQFLENPCNLKLKCNIKPRARDHSAKSFQQIREELQC